MGKRQLGELQPSELVSTILISNLASISIESPELPLAGSVVPVFIIVCLEILVSIACVRSRKIAKLVSGTPKVVIKNGVVDQKMMRELRYTADDLIESLRAKDIFDVASVDYAIVETNGSMSIFKKFKNENPTNKDLNIEVPESTGPSLPMVLDGEVDNNNLSYYKKDEKWLNAQLLKKQCELKNTLLFSCDAQDNIILIKKENSKKAVLHGDKK